jgi:uncharacterized membrane protein YjgN (DUF898 family)
MDQPDTVAGTVRFDFTGSAGEYFRIWIVNVFLTLITLGVYSAWAKVRRNRYLYSSTRVAGASFVYLAQPLQILKGRLIALGVLAVYMASQLVSPLLQLAEMAALMVALPWLVIRARAFALRNTAYRNIRFDFESGYGHAALTYLLWPLIVAVTLGLTYPLYVWARTSFLVEKSRFGSHPFGFAVSAGAFYWVYFKFVLLLVGVLAAGGVLVAGAFSAVAGGSDAGVGLVVCAVAGAVLGLLASLTYAHVAVTNLMWSSVSIGGLRTGCALGVPRMFWIALSSLVAVMASFGLLIPWATIRMARYRVEQMTLENAERLQALLSAKPPAIGAAGEELSDLLGLDVAV